MFANCYNLKELDISGWKINATNYSSFFSACYALENVNISGFNMSNCTTLASMFYNCQNLKEIIFPDVIDITKITTMASIFFGCNTLPELTILNPNDTSTDRTNKLKFSSLTFSNVTTIDSMFNSCISLRTLSINNWKLPNCTTIANLCRYCQGLEELSWTGWEIPKVTSTAPSTILGQCWNLKKITGLPPIRLAFSLADSFSLPLEEVIGVLNNLPDLTGSTARVLNINNMHLNQLSNTEKAIATNKNWTLAN